MMPVCDYCDNEVDPSRVDDLPYRQWACSDTCSIILAHKVEES